jgi:DNA-directed RNA polymerase subunit M/transcription elongation factor TFIIS
MPRFCEVCNNLLSVIATADAFSYKCIKCQRSYQPSHDDSLRYEDTKGTNLIVYKPILKNAGRDPVNPKVRKTCTKCKNTVVRQVRLGDDMRLINICANEKCCKQWIEGLEKSTV